MRSLEGDEDGAVVLHIRRDVVQDFLRQPKLPAVLHYHFILAVLVRRTNAYFSGRTLSKSRGGMCGKYLQTDSLRPTLRRKLCCVSNIILAMIYGNKLPNYQDMVDTAMEYDEQIADYLCFFYIINDHST